jgi:hypothetical protein
MYSMRYGTIPVVRTVGGLKDTVPDIGEPGGIGRGIRFDQFSVEDATHALYRAISMWHNHPDIIDHLRQRIMAVDFSWKKTIEKYQAVYRQVGAAVEPETPAVALSVQPMSKKPAPEPKAKTPAVRGRKPAQTVKQAEPVVSDKPDKVKKAPVAARKKASPKSDEKKNGGKGRKK